jgi:hypothetical protein
MRTDRFTIEHHVLTCVRHVVAGCTKQLEEYGTPSAPGSRMTAAVLYELGMLPKGHRPSSIHMQCTRVVYWPPRLADSTN